MKLLLVAVSLALVSGCDSPSDAPSDAPGAPDASVGKSSLVIEPATFDFGMVATGTTSPSGTFTLHNTGNAPTKTFQFHVDGPFAVDPGTCMEQLAAGESCSFTITFSPISFGPQSY